MSDSLPPPVKHRDVTFVHVFPIYYRGTRIEHEVTAGAECWCEPMVLASFYPETKPRTSILICVHQTDEIDLHVVSNAKVG